MTLSAAYGERPLTFVFGAMRDKAIGEMAETVFPMADRVIVTHASTHARPRSTRFAKLRQESPAR